MLPCDNEVNVVFECCKPTKATPKFLSDCDHQYFINNPRRFTVLSSKEIVEEMNFYVNEVNKILNADFSATITRILLNHYKWDKDILIDKYFGTDNETFFKDAHVVNPFTNEENCNTILKEYKMADCGICLDTTNVTGVLCGHQFCDDCWNKYLTAKIKDDGEEQIFCAEVFCDVIVGDSAVLKLLTDSDVKLKYNRLITNSFVKLNRNLRWCPKPGCKYVIKIISSECEAITCNCGHIFCFGCDEEPHAPISCENLKKWNLDDGATKNYLLAFTKNCPKCQSPIEKNGGCLHMTCKHCNFEFCWNCLVKYIGHTCSSDNLSDSSANKDFEVIKLRQERMRFCSRRYTKNQAALVKEQSTFISDYIETVFVKEGVELLFQCRRTLMYTHAFIFYVTVDNYVELLEFQLKPFKKKTDKLSRLLQSYIDDVSEDETKKPNIMKLIGTLKILHHNILASVKEALNLGRWEQ